VTLYQRTTYKRATTAMTRRIAEGRAIEAEAGYFLWLDELEDMEEDEEVPGAVELGAVELGVLEPPEVVELGVLEPEGVPEELGVL